MVVNKSLTLLGAEADQATAGRDAQFVGGKANTAIESIITAPSVNPGSGRLISVNADNVTIDGFVLDGNNPNLSTSGADRINGQGPYIDVRTGIDTYNSTTAAYMAVNNLTAEYNIVQNVDHNGIAVLGPIDASGLSSGAMVANNLIQNFLDYGVVLGYNAYGAVQSNTIIAPDCAEAPIWIYDFTRSGATSASQTVNVSNNDLTVSMDGYAGIWANLIHPSGTATLNINGNTVNGAADVADDYPVFGIYLTSLDAGGTTVAMNDNVIGSTGESLAGGIAVWNAPGANVSVTGGSISNATVGIDLDNADVNFGGGTGTTTLNVSNVTISGGTVGVRVGAVPADAKGAPYYEFAGPNTVQGSVVLNLSGGSITGAATGIQVQGQSSGPYTASLNLQGGTTISNGAIGLDVDGAEAVLFGNTAGNLAFSGQTDDYISLADGAMAGQVLDATGVTFGALRQERVGR